MNSGRDGIVSLAEHISTRVGRERGLSWCHVCHGTWNWRKHFVIMFCSWRGCIPVCVDCAAVLTIEEILEQCRVHWKEAGDEAHTARYEGYARACLVEWDRAGRTEDRAYRLPRPKDWSPRKPQAPNSQNG